MTIVSLKVLSTLNEAVSNEIDLLYVIEKTASVYGLIRIMGILY